MSNIGKFESIWRTLQYGAKVEEQFKDGTLLKSVEKGLAVYDKPGGDPEAKMVTSNDKLTGVEKSTALRFSALCSLSEKQSLQLFQEHQAAITQQLKSTYLDGDMENDGETSPAILSGLLKVYQKDRIYLIKIINFILTEPSMSGQRSKLSPTFLATVIDQFESNLKSDAVPPRSRDLNSEIIAAMHLQYLREKCFSIETMLLGLDNLKIEMKIETIEKLFKLATKSFFLLNDGSGYLVDSVVADKLKNLSAVLLQIVLIKLVISNLDNVELLKKIDKSVLRLLVENIDVLAPFQLTWAVVRYLHNFDEQNDIVIEKLSTLAFSCDQIGISRVWSVTQRMISLPQLMESPEALTAGAKVILSLIDLVLKHFDIDSIGGAAEVADTISKVFQIDKVAQDGFWADFEFYAGEENGLNGFIERQVKLLPQEYNVTFKIISSLSTDKIGQEKVISLLNELMYISEPITGRETEDEIETNQSGSVWSLKLERTVSGLYQVEPGAKGEPMTSALGPIVQWNLENQPADGWTILEGILTNHDAAPDLIISALKLYTNLKPHKIPVYKDGFESLFKRLLTDYNHEIAGAFLDTMETLDVNLVKKLLPGSNLFGDILSHEKEMATYTNTIKIINLLSDLFEPYQTILAPALNVVFDEIFGAHLSWQYGSLFEKVELSIALLKLINKILAPKTSKESLSSLMFNLFAENESLCRVVLTLSCLNSAEIDDKSSTSERFTTLLINQVSAAFAILEQILEKFQNDENSKMMRLLTQRTDNDSVCGFILKSVSGFIFHQSDSELPYVAIGLLGRLCQLGQVSLNATLGSYVFELRNALLGKMEENERLRKCVVELLATIAEYQPSLLEIFVDLEDDKSKPGEKKIGPNSCLTVILDMLPKQASDELNLTMLESSFRFLHALWAGRRDSHKYFKVLRILRARPEFWNAVFLPFYLDMEVDEHKAILTLAHSFAIVSHEYYFATKLHENFEKKLLQLIEHESTFVEWSKMISIAVERLCEMADETDDELKNVKESLVSLVEGWRCLWSILTPGKELKPIQKVDCVSNGASSCLTLLQRLSDEPSNEVRRMLLLISSATLSNLSKCTFNTAQRAELLTILHKSLEIIHSDPGLAGDGTILVDILSMLSIVLSATSSSDTSTQKVVRRILTRASGFINTANDTVQILSASIIQQTFKILKTTDWLNVISDNNIFQAIITLLAQVATSRTNEKLGIALCSLLIKTSDNAQVMNHFIRLSLLSPLILASENLYSQIDEASENTWPKLFTQLTLLQLQLLKCLGSLYISDALDWTGVHQRRFELILKMAGREGCSNELLNEANTILLFLIKVADYRDMWIQTVGIGGSSAAECLQATARLLVSVPSRARLVQSLDESNSEQIICQYRRLLISSFQLLAKFSAPIMQILLDEGIDAGRYQSILQPTLQEAQIGEMPTFGSCISCLNLGMHFLSSTPRGDDSKKRQEIIFMIDQTIQLLLSQAAHLLLHAEESRELTQFKHQLAAEIENNVNEARRQLKTSWPQSPSASPRANRGSTGSSSSLRRSKSVTEGSSNAKDTVDSGMLRIADQFKREMLS